MKVPNTIEELEALEQRGELHAAYRRGWIEGARIGDHLPVLSFEQNYLIGKQRRDIFTAEYTQEQLDEFERGWDDGMKAYEHAAGNAGTRLNYSAPMLLEARARLKLERQGARID